MYSSPGIKAQTGKLPERAIGAISDKNGIADVTLSDGFPFPLLFGGTCPMSRSPVFPW